MIAFLRDVGASLDRCELTHLAREPIDGSRARSQHSQFAAVLRELGVTVEYAPTLSEQADGVFIEDTALVLPEIAVLARPGARSRAPEVDSVQSLLALHRLIQRLVEPATLDGGDVLQYGRTLMVGQSPRTNAAGIEALRTFVMPFGYTVRAIPVRGCLHLKSGCTFIPPTTFVVNPAWIDPATLGDAVVIPVDETEPFAANTLTIGQTTLVSASFPKTEKRLRNAGILTRAVDISELEKAEGGLTCLCLLVEQSSVVRQDGTEP
jgi:dimethylargininase